MTRVELTRGPSVYRMGRLVLGISYSMFALAALVGLLFFVLNLRDAWVTIPVLVVWATSLGSLAVAGIIASYCVDREKRAGYTTAPHGFIDYPTVDFRTGVVIREAGEPLLDRDEYRKRIAAARHGHLAEGVG